MYKKILFMLHLFFSFSLLTMIVFASEEKNEVVVFDVPSRTSTLIELDNTNNSQITTSNIKSNKTRAIFGSDDRYRVNSYSEICRLDATNPYDNTVITTTATMIGPKVAITAAHGVYKTDLGGLFYNITITPGYSGGDTPYGSSNVSTIYVWPDWIEKNGATDWDTISDSYNYDWAILVLDDSLGNLSGWYGLQKYDNYLDLFNMNISITGYPYYVQGQNIYNNYLYQYQSKGKIDTAFPRRLEYTADTSGGQSGAPIINLSTNNIVGIHGGTIKNELSNRGVRITDGILNTLEEALKK